MFLVGYSFYFIEWFFVFVFIFGKLEGWKVGRLEVIENRFVVLFFFVIPEALKYFVKFSNIPTSQLSNFPTFQTSNLQQPTYLPEANV
jgi:hypothetical protein